MEKKITDTSKINNHVKGNERFDYYTDEDNTLRTTLQLSLFSYLIIL